MPEPDAAQAVKLPSLAIVLQLAQVGAIIIGIIVVSLAVGRRDEMLSQLTRAYEDSAKRTEKLVDTVNGLAQSVARIEGRIESLTIPQPPPG